MKIFVILYLALVVASCSSTSVSNVASVNFEKIEYNFGVLRYGQVPIYNFKFTNQGDTPLFIQNVKTSCGCTVPQWPKKPIKPGGGGKITIKYDAAFPGAFNKTISVYFNGEGSPATLHIKGQVEYPDDLKEENR